MKHIAYKQHDIVIFDLDASVILGDSEFDKDLTTAFDLACIQCSEAPAGSYQTIDYALLAMPGFMKLLTNLYPVVEQARQFYKITNSILSIRRLWANKIYQGCQSNTHRHTSVINDACDFVGIFYYQADELASKLVITELDDIGLWDSDIEESKKQYISAVPARFVFHPPGLVHAVSLHQSLMPRICFVFEFEFIQQNQINQRDICL